MKTKFAALLVLPIAAIASFAAPNAAPAPAPEPAVFHCQVPCGIYGDKLRIDMLMEDCATIEKGIAQIAALEAGDGLDKNQLVRWIMTKDEHAQMIQDQVASYWLAQRIKSPELDAAKTKYHGQLEMLHGITVSAMKCKQTVDPAHVAKIRALVEAFSKTYFSPEDMQHLKEHTFGGEK